MAIVRNISEVFESPVLLKLKEMDKKRAEKFIERYRQRLKNNKKACVNNLINKLKMNNANRKELEKAIAFIEDAKGIIEQIKDEEQEKFDNLSEGLQQTERGQKFEETASVLDDAFSQLEEAIDNINTATE
jgi:hypothetical protein